MFLEKKQISAPKNDLVKPGLIYALWVDPGGVEKTVTQNHVVQGSICARFSKIYNTHSQ